LVAEKVVKDLQKMTKAELIQRLQELEAKSAITASRPLTEQPIAEKLAGFALHDSNERLRAILRTAVEGIITIDERGLIESINPAAEHTFGFKAEEVVGQNVSVLMPSPYREEHNSYLSNYLRTGKAKIIGIGREVVGRRKDGSVFPMDLAVSEVILADRRLFTGFIRDISERKKAEANLAALAQTLGEKNKELETIVYVASHDLRSPLVNIQGFSKELALACEGLSQRLSAGAAGHSEEVRILLTEDIPEALSYIQAGVAKIDTLLTGFLRYSRLGRASLRIEPLNMNALLATVVQAMEFQIKRSGATVQVDKLPECLGDETQINAVFSNLLDNAIKYLDSKRPGQIRVTGHCEQDRVNYAVHDNGIGIAPEHQPKIFEIFHRLNPSLGEGEGLGLTIAQRILERLNGQISVQSQPGQGSTFLLSLPAPPQVKISS
jgi:PAS domain S-box-containing protein